MKKKLLRLRAMLCFGLLLSFYVSNAQINYSEGFDDLDNLDWTTDAFYWEDTNTCDGDGVIILNLYDGWISGYTGEVISPSVGTSSGGQATLTYQYKILDYDAEPSVPTTNDQGWGSFRLFYGPSNEGPWTQIDQVTPANHIESADCATRTATFFPPVGTTVFIRAYGVLDGAFSDFLIYFDDVNITQVAPVNCSGTPAAAVTVSAVASACTTGANTLSLNTSYTDGGITYQWQTSPDNVTYTNVATGGTASTYSAIQATATWYRAMITCTNSTQSVTSTPVQVLSTGSPCYCDVDFYNGTEPITSVIFAGINNQSTNDTDSEGMEDFTALTPAQVTTGQSYPITLKGNTAGLSFTNYFTVYADWNQNGDFTDAGEQYEIGSITGSDGLDDIVATGNILVPANALAGITTLRVFKSYDDPTTSPCSAADGIGYGQVEDYKVNVTVAPPAAALTWVNLQSPATLTINQGETGTVYAQAYGETITEAAGAGTGVSAWIGISAANTNPSQWTTWVPATFNVQSGNNDEFMAAIGATLAPGTYYYASRFQLNTGAYLYGGFSATGGGLWSAANSSGVLTVNCNVAAPTVEPLAYCAGVTGAELPAEDGLTWYFGPTGDNAIPDATVITSGTFFVSRIEGTCESPTRTPVVITVTTATAPEIDDVIECDSYTLPALTAGNYFTATGGTGTQLAAGAPITETTQIFVYVVATANADCTAETSFTVTINSVGEIEGEANQNLTGSDIDPVTTGDIEIETDNNATVVWYSDEALTTVVAPDAELIDGATYYAVQTSGDCSSEAFAVTVSIEILGRGDFAKGSFAYYPNPVNDVLTLNYVKNISGVQVHNLLGQIVVDNKGMNATQVQLNLGSLTAGTYMVKVIAEDGAAKTIKVVKN